MVRVIQKTFKVDGVPTDVDSALLSDPTGAYGVRREDTLAVVVADSVAMSRTGVGVYEYTFTDVAGVAYKAWVELVYDGNTYHFEVDFEAQDEAAIARTTLANVQGIIDIDPEIVPDAAAAGSFILPANALVTEVCTGAAGPTPAYSGNRLELIERWLAAHFYTQRDPRAASEKAGSVSANYQSKVDLGLDNSHYGQMAMRLDTNGGLAKLNHDSKRAGKPKVGVTWAGTARRQGTLYPGHL